MLRQSLLQKRPLSKDIITLYPLPQGRREHKDSKIPFSFLRRMGFSVIVSGWVLVCCQSLVYLANFSSSCLVPVLRNSTVALVFSPVPSTFSTVPMPKR